MLYMLPVQSTHTRLRKSYWQMDHRKWANAFGREHDRVCL